jgi:hypothetical protein
MRLTESRYRDIIELATRWFAFAKPGDGTMPDCRGGGTSRRLRRLRRRTSTADLPIADATIDVLRKLPAYFSYSSAASARATLISRSIIRLISRSREQRGGTATSILTKMPMQVAPASSNSLQRTNSWPCFYFDREPFGKPQIYIYATNASRCAIDNVISTSSRRIGWSAVTSPNLKHMPPP